jgi:hypothetical protein
VLSNRCTEDTSVGRKQISMQTIFELDWMPFTSYATKDTLRWMWNRNCFAAQWMF